MSVNASTVTFARGLQEYFVDKTTGLPLAAGTVTFYSDVNRTTLKTVYTQTGTPGAYTYIAITNPAVLSAAGTMTDGNGNDIIPYYFPFTDSSASTTELYYIVVKDSNGVTQFTREGWPNSSTDSNITNTDIVNYVSNGQFWNHNSNIPLSTTNFNSTNIDYTAIAPGGWYFARAHGSTATDAVSFFDFQNYNSVPLDASPRFACRLVRTVGSSDAVCDIRLRYYDVNKFSNSSSSPNLCYTFTALSNSGSPVNASLRIYYYYGSASTGVTPHAPEYSSTVSSFTIPITETQITPISLNFGTTAGKTIGVNGDDFVEVCITLPAQTLSTFDVQFTDFILTQIDNISVSQFPPTPNSSFNANGIFGYADTPSYSGNDFYLPIILTPYGVTYDHSQIGQVNSTIYSSSYASTFARLLCDGGSYVSSQYSSIGIPYQRLGTVLTSNSPIANTPMYGTGSNFATAYVVNGNTAILRLTVNTAGTVTAAADSGSAPTGFTFTNVHTGAATINYNAVTTAASTVFAVGTFTTPNGGNQAAAGNSGFTVTSYLTTINTQITNATYAFQVATIAASSMTAGHYFTFSNASTNYYMWFKINGSGADPAPGGTGIEVDILSTFTAQDVANVVREAINQLQMTDITVGALPPASSYFTFSSNPSAAINYYVWYTVNSVGTDPAPASKTGIHVILTGSETNAQVITKTLTAINAYQYAVPDFRGMFLRGVDPNSTWDIDSASRWSTVTALSGANLGTFEYSQIISHTHIQNSHTHVVNNGTHTHAASGGNSFVETGGANNTYVDDITVGSSGVTFTKAGNSQTVTGDNSAVVSINSATAINNLTGGTETRPVNAYVNWFINY